jgi:hypothetical protein
VAWRPQLAASLHPQSVAFARQSVILLTGINAGIAVFPLMTGAGS